MDNSLVHGGALALRQVSMVLILVVMDNSLVLHLILKKCISLNMS